MLGDPEIDDDPVPVTGPTIADAPLEVELLKIFVLEALTVGDTEVELV